MCWKRMQFLLQEFLEGEATMHSLATGTQEGIGYLLSPLHWAGGQWFSEKTLTSVFLGVWIHRWDAEGQIHTKYRTHCKHHHERLAATGHTVGRQFTSGCFSVMGSRCYLCVRVDCGQGTISKLDGYLWNGSLHFHSWFHYLLSCHWCQQIKDWTSSEYKHIPK